MRRTRSQRRLVVGLGAALAVASLALAAALSGPGDAGAAEPAGFCRDGLARDFAAPFQAMPREKPPPEGELPFGPRNLSMYRIEWSRIVRDGSQIGYRFGAKDAGTRTLHLNWKMDGRLWAIDRKGRPLREVGHRGGRFGDVEDINQLTLVFPAKVGLYRYDLTFRNLKGKVLGSYREYFRVLPRLVKVGLAVARDSYRPGETAYARVRNLGTDRLFVPSRLPVERWVAGSWLAVPPAVDSTDGEGSWWIEAGEAVPCASFAIPADAPAGPYRFKASVYAVSLQRRVVRTAAFRVEP